MLAHLGFHSVVINRVPLSERSARVRRREREFSWRSPYGSHRGVFAHLLRRHYNLPRALDFEKSKGALADPAGAASALAVEMRNRL